MKRKPFGEMVGDYQAMPGADLDRELKWFAQTIPMLQRQKAAAMKAKRLQRRKVSP